MTSFFSTPLGSYPANTQRTFDNSLDPGWVSSNVQQRRDGVSTKRRDQKGCLLRGADTSDDTQMAVIRRPTARSCGDPVSGAAGFRGRRGASTPHRSLGERFKEWVDSKAIEYSKRPSETASVINLRDGSIITQRTYFPESKKIGSSKTRMTLTTGDLETSCE